MAKKHAPSLSSDELLDLQHFLTKPTRKPCDHTLKQTRQFLKRRKLPVDEILAWMEVFGGYCDCEVMLNVCFRLIAMSVASHSASGKAASADDQQETPPMTTRERLAAARAKVQAAQSKPAGNKRRLVKK